jgi:hypothetical protein
MKRFILLTAAAATLVSTGVAVAHHRSSDVSQVSATLSATTVSHLRTWTLTCEGGETLEISNGRYSGTATSATPDLSGGVELRIHSVYNTTKRLGWVEGRLWLRGADNRSVAHLSAVNVDGKLDGWLRGSAGHRDGRVFGSLTGSFTRSGGLTDGQFGTGTGANAALLARNANCRASNKTRPSVHLIVRGQVDALSATSISVKPADGGASVTCTIGDRKPERIAVGDRVQMTCSQINGAWVLTKIHKRR